MMSLSLELSYLKNKVEKLEENLLLRNKDLTTRVANLEKHVELLYEENKELKECNCRIGKAIGLSQKQQDQLKSYHEGHEEQQGYDHYDEPDYEDNMPDNEADAQTLASAGFGTDEDYGSFSEDGSDRL